MKIEKSTLVIVAILFLAGVLVATYLHNRSIANLESVMIEEVKAKAEAEAKAAFDKERKKFEDQQTIWNKQAEMSGKAYSEKTQEAENERRAKEAARRANSALNLSWEDKYGRLDLQYKTALDDWKKSDEQKDVQHNDQIGKLKLSLDGANARIAELNEKIEGKFDAAGALIDPGYIQKLIEAQAMTELEKRKAHRIFYHGPGGMLTYRDGKADAWVGYCFIFKFGSF